MRGLGLGVGPYRLGSDAGYRYAAGAGVFNGTTSYVTLGLPSALTAIVQADAACSISWWAKRALSNSVGAFISKGAGTGNRTLQIQTAGGTGNTVDDAGVTTVNNLGVTNNAHWHHLVYRKRFNGTNWVSSLVVDGFLAITPEVISGTFENTDRDITIGGRRNASNADIANVFTGNISEVEFFDRHLTDAECVQMWARPGLRSALPSGRVSWHPLAGNALDLGGLGLHGTAAAMSWATTDVPKQSIVPWGDSLTDGTGSALVGAERSYIRRAALCANRANAPKGFPSQGSTYIRGQFEAFPQSRDAINIFWIGRNGVLTDSGVILADIQAMANQMPHGRWLVMSITNRRDGTEDLGSANYLQIQAVNAQLAAAFGPRFFDVRAWIIAGASGGDSADVAADRIPASLAHTDNLHLNDAGYNRVADGVAAKLAALGWNN
jgi:lysophospholipase L1-like esterase